MGAWAVIRRRTRIIWRLAVAFTGLLGGMWLGDLLVPRRTVSLNDTRPAISRLAEPPGGPQTVLLLVLVPMLGLRTDWHWLMGRREA